MRPKELADDHSTTLDAILHALNELKSMSRTYDVLVLLQPTQPLRTAEDVDMALEKFVQCGRSDLVSVCEVKDHPLLIRSVSKTGELKKLIDCSSTCRRQDMPKYYRVNGCIYINNISDIDEHTSFNDNGIPFIMQRSHSVDIDEMSDLYAAEYYLKHPEDNFD